MEPLPVAAGSTFPTVTSHNNDVTQHVARERNRSGRIRSTCGARGWSGMMSSARKSRAQVNGPDDDDMCQSCRAVCICPSIMETRYYTAESIRSNVLVVFQTCFQHVTAFQVPEMRSDDNKVQSTPPAPFQEYLKMFSMFHDERLEESCDLYFCLMTNPVTYP